MVYICNHTFIENKTEHLDIFDNANNFYSICLSEREDITFSDDGWIDFDVLKLSVKCVIECLKTITKHGIFKYYNKSGNISVIKF